MSPARVSGLISAGGPATRRAGWGVADQALSSLTNFGLAVVLARGLTAEGFGAASITFAHNGTMQAYTTGNWPGGSIGRKWK